MKPTRLLTCAALLLGLTVANVTSSAATAPAPAKKPTYAVVGYYRLAAPAPALVEKAVQEVGVRMKDCTAVKDPEKADQVVNVVFKDNAYQIYFDGPSPEAVRHGEDMKEANGWTQAMLLDAKIAENTGGHGRGK